MADPSTPLVLRPLTGPAGEPGTRTEWDSGHLGARLAALARRIADLLTDVCGAEPSAAEASAYLRSYASAAEDTDPIDPAPLERLADHFGLTPDERTLLLLAGLPEEHEGLASTFRALHPRAEPRPTVSLGALLTCRLHGDRERLRRVLAAGAATRAGVLRTVGDGPLYERSLVVAPALWEAVHGADAWPSTVERISLDDGDGRPDADGSNPRPPAGLAGWLERPEVSAALANLRRATDSTLMVMADDERVGLSRCAALAAAIGAPAVGARVDAADSTAVGLVVAHAVARGALPVLSVRAPTDGAGMPRLDLGDVAGPVLVVVPAEGVRPVGRRPALHVPAGPVGVADRRRAWSQALPELGAQAAELAACHPLDPAAIAEVAADARARWLPASGLPAPESAGRGGRIADVSAVIRGRAGVALPAGVRLTTPSAGWDRLVLPARQAAQLRDAVDRVRLAPTVLDDWGFLERVGADRGVRMLFAGPPGTGKSLAAEVVAAEAATDLLVVDVAAVVSKWIGETEKNLAAIFDVAERTRAVLLLDEADALFGARTRVSDAHDRYANLETAYLLTRLDRFDGLAVLATNLRQNIDAAFVRRMDFVVEFGLPAEDDRLELWRRHLPSSAPLAGDLDRALLARRYPVPGAWIRNAAIAAAFLAAADDAPLAARHVVRALRREYAKAAQPCPGDPEECP
jgi:hypothetical protein